MPCQGLASENYDLYVLGLPDDGIREHIDAHLSENCEACHNGVRRSLSLWTSFALGVEENEPPADLRKRLVRVAELTKRASFTPLKRIALNLPTRWWVEGIAATVAILIALIAWFAGRQSGLLQNQQLTMVLLDTQQHVASLEVSLKQERSKRNIAEQALKNAGKPNTEDQMETQRQQVLRLQAEVNRYGSVIDRDQKLLSDNMRLVSALSSQGVQLIPMKGLESAAHSVAYSLVLPNSKLLLVASSLPNLPPSREYQLWLLRRTEPKILSGGVFNVDEANHALVEFAEGSLINEIEGISVTEEPAGGSTAAPTGPKVLSAVIER